MRQQNVYEVSNSSEKLVLSRYIESARSFCKGKGRSSKLRMCNVFYLFTCRSCIAGEKKAGKSSGKAVIAWRSTQRNLKVNTNYQFHRIPNV
ncbi:hypothetical protein SUGI_0304970 [Cryptomeria japonica]|nr:hypothetical protein SUGI_0304970 [Cryptomeria japonica]